MSIQPKQQPDWERIEADYRAGIKSLREIAAEHGLSHGAINKRAKRDAWDRDLNAKIQARADALVSKRVVSAEVSKARADTERQTVEANAQAIADVKLAHRADIRRGRDLVAKLLTELEGLTDEREMAEVLREAVAGDADDFKLRAALDKVLSLPGRVQSVKGLAEALKSLVGLEREAWGMDTQPAQQNPVETMSDAELLAEVTRLRGKIAGQTSTASQAGMVH